MSHLKTSIALVGLTKKQRALYDYIYTCITETGVTPTIRIIADRFDHKSASSAHRMVDSLIQRGMLSRDGMALTLTMDLNSQEYQSIPPALLSPMVCNHFDEFIGMNKGTMRQIVQDAMLYRKIKKQGVDL